MTKQCKAISIIILMFLIPCTFAQSVGTSREVLKPLSAPGEPAGFNFAIFSDRTGGDDAEGMGIFKLAVQRANEMQPEFVYTVGDYIQGYSDRPSWLKEKDAFLTETAKLQMPWYPVAGNHDVYWTSNIQDRPKTHHEGDYENHYGPLWYAFEYKKCWFITLFSDEGDPGSGQKGYKNAGLQKISDAQYDWLRQTLDKAKDADHVFIFQHHPRWLGAHYGDDWQRVHDLLKKAGNVSAVFAGHYHRMDYQQIDGIDYYILGTTGGGISPYATDRLHVIYWVGVRGPEYSLNAIPLLSLIDPKTRRTRTITLLERQSWDIASKDTQTLEWKISTKEHSYICGWLEIMIAEADDDSGDHAVQFTLFDADRVPLKTGTFNDKGDTWFDLPVNSGLDYYLQITDPDVSFEGQSPGNQGQIEVLLRYYENHIQER